ncbi:MAG: NADH-quinone oxidoreductase subunit J [Nitrososphaerales archaeon]
MTDFLFLAIATITIASAILALESRELVYGAVALAIAFLGVAGIFILLDAIFLAMMQVLVYVGSIAVLIIFVVMLVRREKWVSMPLGKERIIGIISSVSLVAFVGFVVFGSGLTEIFPSTATPPSFFEIGRQLLTDYWLSLQVLGLVLALAVIGALTMAKIEGTRTK